MRRFVARDMNDTTPNLRDTSSLYVYRITDDDADVYGEGVVRVPQWLDTLGQHESKRITSLSLLFWGVLLNRYKAKSPIRRYLRENEPLVDDWSGSSETYTTYLQWDYPRREQRESMGFFRVVEYAKATEDVSDCWPLLDPYVVGAFDVGVHRFWRFRGLKF